MLHPYYIVIAILFALLFTFIVYLIYASAYSLWPFKNKKSNINTTTTSKYSSRLRGINNTPGVDDNKFSTGIGIILMMLFFGFFIFIIYLVTRANIARYQLASQAIKSGQGGVAAAALAPEIGEGIGDLFGGFRNRY